MKRLGRVLSELVDNLRCVIHQSGIMSDHLQARELQPTNYDAATDQYVTTKFEALGADFPALVECNITWVQSSQLPKDM